MELRVLQYFLMIAREENITRAARLLHVTQPTLSRQIMQLEEELGVTLFRRSNHAILLTEDGMLLKRRAQEMLDLAEKTTQELAHGETELAGTLSIGCGELLSMDTLAGLLADFRSVHPGVRVTLYSGTADLIRYKIEMGLLDFGLMLEPVEMSKYSFLPMPVAEEWCVIVPEDSPLAAQPAVELLRLPPHSLMFSGSERLASEFRRRFGEDFDGLDSGLRFDLTYNATAMVRKGMGYALTLRLASSYDGVVCVPLSPRQTSGSVLAWKKDQASCALTQAFIEYAREKLTPRPQA